MKVIQIICIALLVFIVGTVGYIYHTWTHAYLPYIAGIPVLNYHQVDDTGAGPLTVHSEHFREQMEYLHAEDYTPITLDELEAYLSGEGKLPWKPVLITLDDGYEDNYTKAYPILQEYGFKATIFMIADDIDKKGFLTADQLKELSANGIDIQAHTNTHRPQPTLSHEEKVQDMKTGKEVLERLLHKDVKYLAYPQGKFDDDTEAAAREVGFTRAFTVGPGFAKSDDDPFATPRMPIFEGATNWFINFDLYRIRLHLPDLVSLSTSAQHFALEHHFTWVYNIILNL